MVLINRMSYSGLGGACLEFQDLTGRSRRIAVNLRMNWPTKQVPGWSWFYSETLSPSPPTQIEL